jgi:hypothetical protein
MADKNFNRDTTRGDDWKNHPKDSNIGREVDELVKMQATDYQAWQKLKSKYGNNPELMDKILEAYKNKLQSIYKRAKKFKQVLYDRYAGLNLPHGELLRKAKKFQKKYKFTDEEFDMFVILSMTDKSLKYSSSIPSTKMAKTLGYDAFMAASSKLNVKADEQSIVEEIINRYGETKPIHAQVLLQSLTYQDCAPESLSGEFDAKKHNPYSYVHPVVAALFIPRIKCLDEQMLMANIGYIVHRKATEQQIMTSPDFKLYWDMITDPNDTACTINNAIIDLKNRFILQTQLWDAVMNLRQGRYYLEGQSLVKFMQALENCRNIIHDAPDLTYVKDEGTILRRLLSAFSLYPTYVSINRLWGLLIGTQYGYPASPYDAAGFANITRVPMITLRLPLNITGNARAVSLEEALTQPQWFVENKVIVPKSLQIIHSNDVLFFYVGRRYQTINFARMAFPFNFTNLPMTVTGWESLNPHPVNAPKHLNIMNDTYELRSVVLVEKTNVHGGRDMIVGSSALIVKPMDPTAGIYEETCFLYDPHGAGMMYPNKTGSFSREKPIKLVPSQLPFNPAAGIESFEQKASTRGTIFMYQKITNNDNPFFSN